MSKDPIKIELSNVQKHLEWLKKKIYLDNISKTMNNRVVIRGQVYRCSLGVGIGSEQTKDRPCLIINNNSSQNSPKTIIAPITHTYKNLPCIVKIKNKFDSQGNLCLDGYVNVSEIREVSKARLGDYVCDLSKDEIKCVDNALAVQLGIKHYYDKSNNILNDKLVYISKLNDILDGVKEKIGAKNNKEILEKIQIILDNSKK